MKLHVVDEPAARLSDYGSIPAAFEVTQLLDVLAIDGGLGGLALRARAVSPAFVKDYDILPDHRPSKWAARWDLTKWWFAAAFLEGRRVGGIAIVVDTSEIEGAAARADVALIWDIRVAPEYRQQGVGSRLIAFAERHLHTQGVRHLKAETQNINTAACRFYARSGYLLRAIDQLAYADLPDEAQMVWQKELRARSESAS